VTSEKLYFAFLALLTAERGVELAISKRNARRAFAAGGYEVGKDHYRPMALLHTLFFVSCAAEVALLQPSFSGPFCFVALALALCAQGLRYAAVTSLGTRWNVRIIVWPGAPVVTRGPYHFVRHPNYVAVAVELASVPLVHGAYLTAIVFSAANAAMLAIRIRAEERALGASYEEAFRDRPRMIPRFFGG